MQVTEIEGKSFSQFGQDLLVSRFFEIYPPKTKFFIDVGAFDGLNFSNSRLFYYKGWSGLCIEACLSNFEKLDALYHSSANVRTIRMAVSDYSGKAHLNIATIPGREDWGSDVSCLDDEEMSRWPDYHWQREEVEVETLTKILERNEIETLDFLTIDIEGEDLRALKGLDLRKYRPALILIEYGPIARRYEILSLARSEGYRVWIDNGQDLFLVKGLRLKLLPSHITGMPQLVKSRIKLWLLRWEGLGTVMSRLKTRRLKCSGS